MTRSSRCHIVLLLVLLPAALQAAEPRRGAEPLRSASAAAPAWDVLARVWSYLTGAQFDNGCSVDPNGRCLTGTRPTTAADNGCQVDPNGLCRMGQTPTATADNGCRIDPNGFCLN